MKPSADFETFLFEAIQKQQPPTPEPKTAGTPFVDYMSKIFFEQKSFVNKRSQYQTQPKPTPPPKQESKQTPAPKPKRVKRELTFDQQKALKVFFKFGEKTLDDSFLIDEIKSAYRRLAKKYHPDAGVKSDEHFKEISAAYKKLIILQ